ncbi:hypothetical protein ACFP1I_32385 [Dyadobacter subterraneus]|uniref:Uncharacterized protein n=1 Tax=Dyadobacter subterraneus TaxID=2773304 RepID=A0ABR9WE68_9BACT|nr:hypothetical protein [Dyadobacter subterraneus]MBE9463720.1 hypothetical protein [Dyadobacter subterraneus]
MNNESEVRPEMYVNGGLVIGSKKREPFFENAVSGEILTSAVSDKVSVKDILAVVANFSLGITNTVSRLTFATLTYLVTAGSAGR